MSTPERIPIVRSDVDGSTIDGTARVHPNGTDFTLDDFRDLDGVSLVLPPGSCFTLHVADLAPV